MQCMAIPSFHLSCLYFLCVAGKGFAFLSKKTATGEQCGFSNLFLISLGCTAGKGVVGGREGAGGRSRGCVGGALLSTSLIRRHVAPSVIFIPMIDLLSLLPPPPPTN
jgi:hypothetical protein